MVEFWEVYYFTMSIMALLIAGLTIAIIGFTVVHGFKLRKKDEENEK